MRPGEPFPWAPNEIKEVKLTASEQNNKEKQAEITLSAGGKTIPAILNTSLASKELISRLPYTVDLHRYEHDYCGVMGSPLPYNKEDLKNGWKNGEIAFAADGGYFAILYKDEEISMQFGNLVALGQLCEDPLVMETLPARISLTIDLK